MIVDLDSDQVDLVRSLLTYHRINLEGNIAAIEDTPSLQAVAQEGVDVSRRQLVLVESVLDELDG